MVATSAERRRIGWAERLIGVMASRGDRRGGVGPVLAGRGGGAGPGRRKSVGVADCELNGLGDGSSGAEGFSARCIDRRPLGLALAARRPGRSMRGGLHEPGTRTYSAVLSRVADAEFWLTCAPCRGENIGGEAPSCCGWTNGCTTRGCCLGAVAEFDMLAG